MTFLILVDLTVAYVQYIYILLAVSPKSFPDIYSEPFRSLRYLSLNFIDSISESDHYENPLEIQLPNWIPLDYRLQFVFISVIVPLLVSLLGILVVCSTDAFAWILMVVVTMFTMFFGIILMIDPLVFSTDVISFGSRIILLSVSSSLTVLLILMGLGFVYFLRKRLRRREDAIMANTVSEAGALQQRMTFAEKAVSRSEINWRALAALSAYEERKKLHLRRCRFRTFIAQFFLGSASVMTGIIFLGWLPVSNIRFLQKSKVGHGTGGVLLFAGFITFLWVFLSTFTKGRRFQLKIRSALSGFVMDVLMLVISLIYNPVLMYVVSIFLCIETSCTAGQRLVPSGSIVRSANYSFFWDPPENPCHACNFSAHKQQCSKSLQEKLCGNSFSQSRLVYDQGVSCDEINSFYKITAVVIMLAYIVSYPIFLLVVADRGMGMVEKEYPLRKRLCDEFTEKELYHEKLMKSVNVAASIYKGYKRRHRRARLLFLFQRVLLVLTSSLTRRLLSLDRSWIGIGVAFGIVMMYFIYIVAARPFARPVENIYGASHQLILAALAALGIAGNRLGMNTVPFSIVVLLAVLIFIAPLAALITGLVCTFRNECERAKRLRRRLESGFIFVRNNPHCSSWGVNSGSDDMHKVKNDVIVPSNEISGSDGNSFIPKERQEIGLSSLDTTRNRKLTGVDTAVGCKNSDQLLSKTASCEVSQTIDKNVNAEFEEIEDDYFCDKRLFVPGAYFRGFDGVPIVTREELEDKEGQEGQQHEVLLKKTGAEETFRHIISRFNICGTLWPQRGESTTPRMRETGRTSFQGKDQTNNSRNTYQVRNRYGEEDNDSEDTSENESSRRGKLFDWWRQWRKVFQMGTTPLQYGDVLERRKELKKVTGIRERPFWLDPSETQLHAYRFTGNVGLQLGEKSKFMQEETFTGTTQGSFFRQIRAMRNTEYPPLVVPDESNSLVTGDQYMLDDDTHHLGGNAALPIRQAQGRVTPKLTSAFTQRLEANQETQIDATEDFTFGSKKSKSPFGISGSKQMCFLNAQRKLEQLNRDFPRDIEHQHQRTRRLTVFAPVIPKVCLEGMHVENWDTFLEDILAEVSTLPSKSSCDVIHASGGEESESERATCTEKMGALHSSEEKKSSDTVERREMDENPLKGFHLTGKLCASQSQQQDQHEESLTAKRVLLLKRHFALRRHLCLAFKNQREQLRSLQKAVDFRIAVTIKKYLQIFFILLGVFTTLALVLSLRGMLDVRRVDFVDGVHRTNKVEYELMGYNNWENFTKHCCCVSVTNLTPVFPYYVLDTEDWLCDDGRVKQRVRRDTYESTETSGYNIRELCGMTFQNGCKMTVTSDNLLELTGCNESITESQKKRW